MEFVTHKTKPIGCTGTCLQGYIDVSYSKIVDVFGEPSGEHDDYKSDADWVVEFEDGIIATIYNYKDGKNYLGRRGTEKEDITDWHIGGFNKEVVELIKNAIKM